MRARGILARLAAALLLLVFMAYIGYQVVSNLSDSIVTIDATVVTVEDVISVEGVFARAQSLVRGQGGQTAEYLVADGEKVAKGQDLIIFLSDGAAVSAYQELRDIDSQLDALHHVLGSVAGGGDAKRLDGQIYSSLLGLSSALDAGNAGKAAEGYPLLQQLVVARGMGVESDFAAQIEALETRRRAVQGELSGSATRLAAEAAGYFFRYPDGFETALTPEAMDSLTPEALRGLQAERTAFEPDVVGTLVEGFEWYFAAVCDKGQADAIKGLGTVSAYFPQITTGSIKLEVWRATTYGSETVLILKSGLMDSAYLGARHQPADLVASSYTGIKVPREALRQVEGQWGVYCLDGAQSKFKPVQWIYQTDTYVLVEQAKNSAMGLYMYDKIITQGKDLADNKVVR